MESTSATASRDKTELKKGPWTAAEDAILMEYVKKHGEGNWNQVQKNSGLARCGKSCRLRWANHLRPNLKKGAFSPEEERLIFELHAKLGNKWARMAAQLPGRTDNEIKNYWNTRVKRRLRQGLPLYPQDIHQSRSGSKRSFSYLHSQQGKPVIPKCPSTDCFLLSPKSPVSPTLPLHLSSLPQHSSPPLSVYHNPVSLPSTQVFTPIVTPPILGSQFGRYKRYNRNLSLPLLSTPSVTSAILGQTMPITSVFPSTSTISSSMPMPAAQYVQDSSPLGSSESMLLSCSSPFSFDPLPYSQPRKNSSAQFLEQGNLMLSTEDINNITTAAELPSNQLFPNTANRGNDNSSSNYDDGMNMNMNMDSRDAGSGLLDDLLRQAQEMSHNEEFKKTDIFSWEQGKGLLDGLDGSWEISFSDHAAAETHSEPQAVRENKMEAMHMDSMSEDLSSILRDMPPMTQHYSAWNSSMGDISNGLSPYPADDNLGLDIHQLNSVSSSNWDIMPRIY